MKALLLSMTAVLLAIPGGAATFCVTSKMTPGCASTIQGGVDAAGAGDLVTVAAGTYYENVVVPAGKDNLQIVGAGKLLTIVDPDLPRIGNGITVQADNVTIKNLAVRNGLQHGIYLQGDNALVQGCRVVGQRSAVSYGIGGAPGATGLQIIANEVRGQHQAGIMLTGGNDDALVQGNVVSASPVGIGVAGHRSQVRLNRVSLTQQAVITSGTDAVVHGNTTTYSIYGIFAISGNNPTITSNRALGGGWGIATACTSCTAGLVSANTATGTGYGIYTQADGPGLVVKSNRATALYPFVFSGQGTTGSLNVGQGGGHGFACTSLMGDGFTVSASTMTCSGPAFFVYGDDNTLSQNLVIRSADAAFKVDGNAGANSNNVLIGNRSLASWGQAFTVFNAAIGTSLTGNTALAARVGFCDQGNGFTVATGNSFGTTSLVCDVQQ